MGAGRRGRPLEDDPQGAGAGLLDVVEEDDVRAEAGVQQLPAVGGRGSVRRASPRGGPAQQSSPWVGGITKAKGTVLTNDRRN